MHQRLGHYSYALDVEPADDPALVIYRTNLEAKLARNDEHKAHRVAVAAILTRTRKTRYVRTVTPGALQREA